MSKHHIKVVIDINIVIIVIAVCSFLFFSCIRLDGQGLYYDEVHQAVGSFAYVGNPTYQFESLTFHNIPIMNLNYSGAIKTAVYGLYMRIFDQSFSVISWRLVGILMVSIALLLFGVLLYKILSSVGLAIFYFLVITDITVLLTTRHDWGPTALALSLRLILLAFWIRGELSKEVKPRNTFLLVFLVAFSLFEKLSSVVLIIPLILMIFLNPKRRNKAHMIASVYGGLVGASPLIFANLLSYFTNDTLISFQFQKTTQNFSYASIISYAKEYLALGAGQAAQWFILGIKADIFSQLELILFSSIILFVLFTLFKRRFAPVQFRLSGILLLCYFIIMIQFPFIPQDTWIHHWIIGTPFQYLAIALFFSGLLETKTIAKKVNYGLIFSVLLVIFSLYRLSGLVSVERALARGATSPAWDKSLSQMGEFAASRSNSAIFAAEDWGISNQLICFTNGEGIVVQPTDSDGIFNAVKNRSKNELYLIFTVPARDVTPETKKAFLDYINQTISNEWQKVPVDKQIARLSTFEVIKYQRISSP